MKYPEWKIISNVCGTLDALSLLAPEIAYLQSESSLTNVSFYICHNGYED
jgi:hypothetical protein